MVREIVTIPYRQLLLEITFYTWVEEALTAVEMIRGEKAEATVEACQAEGSIQGDGI